MSYTAPTVAEFKARFDRDFSFAVDQTDMERVRDTDITRGITSASANFNEGLWESQAIFSEAYLLLSAHYLVTNLLNSSQGLRSQANWLTNAKSVMSVQESFSIPDRILRSPILAVYSKTGYGMAYLSLIMPRLVGNVALLQGNTTP